MCGYKQKNYKKKKQPPLRARGAIKNPRVDLEAFLPDMIADPSTRQEFLRLHVSKSPRDLMRQTRKH